MKYDTKKFIESCNNDRDMKDYSITGSYKGSKEKIKILHKKCKREFLMIAANFKNLKYSCPLCKRDNMKIFDNDTLDQFLYKDLKNEYLRIGDYKNSSSKLEIKHLKCGNSILI